MRATRIVEDRPVESPSSERRKRRSDCLADALRFQLDACVQDQGVAAIVVSDDIGFCVAHSGGQGTHDELAASLPLLADPRPQPDDSRDGDGDGLPGRPPSLVITSFSVGDNKLYACAVSDPSAVPQAGDSAARQALDRVADGFARLLA